MTDRELMQQALDVIEAAIKAGDWQVDGACDPDYVLEALRARLAQKEPEPVIFYKCNGCEFQYFEQTVAQCDCLSTNGFTRIEYYTAPPPREWQGLTDEEAAELAYAPIAEIEAKLKEKNT